MISVKLNSLESESKRMNETTSCMYCSKNSRLSDLMIKICELDASIVYLFKEQTYKGRCVVVYKQEHKNEIFDLTEENRNAFMNDVSKVASAVHRAFSPGKINYGAYGDKMPHIHFHIVPKYENAPKWGGTFDMMPDVKIILTEKEYEDIINEVKKSL